MYCKSTSLEGKSYSLNEIHGRDALHSEPSPGTLQKRTLCHKEAYSSCCLSF